MIDKLAVFVLTYHKHSREHLDRCFWSIDLQDVTFDYDVIVNYNSIEEDQFEKIKENFPEEYELIKTKSDGFTGKGTNSCLDYYSEVCKERGYSHMCIILCNRMKAASEKNQLANSHLDSNGNPPMRIFHLPQ